MELSLLEPDILIEEEPLCFLKKVYSKGNTVRNTVWRIEISSVVSECAKQKAKMNTSSNGELRLWFGKFCFVSRTLKDN